MEGQRRRKCTLEKAELSIVEAVGGVSVLAKAIDDDEEEERGKEEEEREKGK